MTGLKSQAPGKRPGELVCYRRLPEWDATTLPDGFRRQHNTREGTWARLSVLQGELYFYELDAAGEVLARHCFSPERVPPPVEPGAWHRVAPASDDLRCYLEFWCEQDRYYEKKYKLSPAHSEVVAVLDAVPSASGEALDLGSGRGRNSVFLHSRGFQVTAVDRSEPAIEKLRHIIAAEPACRGIQTDLYDINEARIEKDFDLIVATVVFQFLHPERVGAVIDNLQQRTRPGGLNLIVAPVSSAEHPCPLDFPFTFREGELRAFYAGWTICKYNENPGEFHQSDEHGERLRAHFATLLARNTPA